MLSRILITGQPTKTRVFVPSPSVTMMRKALNLSRSKNSSLREEIASSLAGLAPRNDGVMVLAMMGEIASSLAGLAPRNDGCELPRNDVRVPVVARG